MTEIPAKTPRPIGRTDNFFPGSVKGDSVGVSAAAAEPEAAAAEGREEDVEEAVDTASGARVAVG